MKPLYLVAGSVLALAGAGCGPRTPPVRTALECPAKQGELTRTSAAPDGKTCGYVTSDGAEVTLRLVPVQGGVDGTLSAIETNLLANREKPKADQGTNAAEDPGSKAAADRAAKEAMADAAQSASDTKVDEAGKATVVTEDDGTTRVDLPGIHIVADDKNDTADVQVGPVRIDASGDGATVRIRRDVRLRGEALNPERRGVRAMFLYKGDDLPGGYRFVGYEAGGPKAGPITVATVRSKADVEGDGLYSDVKKLVRRNGGV